MTNLPFAKAGFPLKPFSRNLLGVLLIVFFAFSFSLRAFLLNWDDDTHLYKNEQIQPLSLSTVVTIFKSTVNDTYIPLTTLSFAIEKQFFGLKPWVYHLNNILLHLGVVYLVYLLGGLLGLTEAGALLACLFFGLHPLHVESVAWVTERKDVLYALFYVAALIFYIRYIREEKAILYVLTLAAALLSILAKPMALSLPLILILLDWFLKRRMSLRIFWDKIPFFLLIVPLAWITYALNKRVPDLNFHEAPFIWIWTFSFYIRKFLWPYELIPLYDLPRPVTLFNPEYAIAVSIFIVFILALWLRRKNRLWIFSSGFFFFSIFFILRFDQLRDTNIVADRFMYLPCLGFCFLFGWGMARLLEMKKEKRRQIQGTLTIIFVFLFLKTYSQTKLWKDNIVFWNYVIEKNDNIARAHNHRGVALVEMGEYEKALLDFNRAIELKKDYVKVYCNLGDTYSYLEKYDLALLNLNIALSMDSANQRALASRGILFGKVRQFDAALADLSRLLEINPNSVKDYNNRGVIYKKAGNYISARADFEKAISLAPGFFPAYVNRAKVNELTGDLVAAIKDLNKALALDPKHIGLYLTRGDLFFKLNDFDHALQDFNRILALDSNYGPAYYSKALVYSKLNNRTEATRNFEMARKLGFTVDTQEKNSFVLDEDRGDIQ